MKKGKVVFISGNKRAGKTTLSVKLHKEAGFNFYNFDMILDAIDDGIYRFDVYYDDTYFKFFEEIVERSLEMAENYGIDTVIDTIEFMPRILKNSKYLDKIEVYYLANLDATPENIKEDLLEFSKPFDWPRTCTEEDLVRNINFILRTNEDLKRECDEYGFRLINSSRGENRTTAINEAFEEIVNINREQDFQESTNLKL